MSQPVKLSDSLVLDARITSEVAQRSIAGQIEFWAGLGRAVDGLLRGREVLALRTAHAVRPLSECLESDPETSEASIAMRVSQGGHDVPSEKLAGRFRRTIKNLKTAIQTLPIVLNFRQRQSRRSLPETRRVSQRQAAYPFRTGS